jgi:amino acid transporter
MYMLMFASAILLRKNKPDVKRTYRVPAMTVVASIGFLASLAAFCLGFVPPSGLAGISTSTYPYVMGAVILILGTPPLIFYAVKKPSWKMRKGSSTDSDIAEAN